MKRLLLLFMAMGMCLAASAQVSTLNQLLSEYKASFNSNYVSLSASLNGQYLTISSKLNNGRTRSIRLDMKNTKMSVYESGAYTTQYTFTFKDDNGLDYIEDGKKYLKDSWSISCYSLALKNKTEQAFRNIFDSFASTSRTQQNSGTSTSYGHSSTSSTTYSTSTSTTTTKPASSSQGPDNKTYSCKYFSIKYPSSWKTVIVGDPNSTTSSLTDASVTVRITNPGQEQPVRNIAINMDPYVDWSQIDQSSLPLLKNPIKRQYPNATFVSEPEFVRLASLSGVKMVYTTYMGGFKARFINYVIHKQNGFTYYITACIDDSKASSQTKEINDIINTLTIK